MPKEHSLEDLPKANTELISIEKESLRLLFWFLEVGQLRLEALNQKKLLAFINKQSLKYKGSFMIAQYNSPWALPPFRKNEAMVRILNAS